MSVTRECSLLQSNHEGDDDNLLDGIGDELDKDRIAFDFKDGGGS
jgi:hypothetical protein